MMLKKILTFQSLAKSNSHVNVDIVMQQFTTK